MKSFQLEDTQMNDSHSSSSTSSDEEVLNLSQDASNGTLGKKSIRLQALIQGVQVLILVDSGSSSNFICEELVGSLKLDCQTTAAAKVIIV